MKDVIGLLSKDLLRFIFLFNIDQCFVIVIEIFGAALLKGHVNAALFSFFVFFLVLRRTSLLKTTSPSVPLVL